MHDLRRRRVLVVAGEDDAGVSDPVAPDRSGRRRLGVLGDAPRIGIVNPELEVGVRHRCGRDREGGIEDPGMQRAAALWMLTQLRVPGVYEAVDPFEPFAAPAQQTAA